jgi:hypothetical protein
VFQNQDNEQQSLKFYELWIQNGGKDILQKKKFKIYSRAKFRLIAEAPHMKPLFKVNLNYFQTSIFKYFL